MTGKILHVWSQANQVYDGRDPGKWSQPMIPVPANSPVHSKWMVSCGDLLIFVPHEPQPGVSKDLSGLHPNSGLLAYHPETDTWYGPVGQVRGVHQVGTTGGIWIGTEQGLIYADSQDVVATAKASGLVMKTDDYLKRRQQAIDGLPPIDRSKIYFSMRDFARAKQELLAIIEQEPENHEALELLGDLHNRWCLNEPADARLYYQRLGRAMSNRGRALQGRYYEYLLLRDDKNWQQVGEVAAQAMIDFPDMGGRWQKIFTKLRDEVARQAGVKQ